MRPRLPASALICAVVVLAVGLPSLSGDDDEPKKVFAGLYSPGPAWIQGKPVWEQPLKEHGDYMHSLYKEGKLTHGGPFLDSSGGLSVYLAASEEKAREILANDPAIKSGVFKAELRPWFQVDWESYGRPAGRPENDEMEKPAGAALGTVIVATTDMERLAAFYRKGLGIDAFEAFGEDHLGARIGTVYFGIDRVEKAPSPGPVSVWFRVDDLEATFERFLALGAKERMKPTEKPWGDRLASVLDPDGNLVGLSQRR